MTSFEDSIQVDLGALEPEHRRWLVDRLLQLEAQPLPQAVQRQARALLECSERVERDMHRSYPHIKRFSLEGLDSFLVALATLIDESRTNGIKHLLTAMSHRGRINTLINIFGADQREIHAAFERSHTENFQPFDLPYHFGATSTFDDFTATLLYNPSHLELIGPTLIGRVRALQDRIGASSALAVVAHGDAAFAGQGIVPETMNLAKLQGYTVRGTIHVILNNQIGFTAETREYMSMQSCTDIAAAFGIPVIHVDAYDTDAVIIATQLAFAYRQKSQSDVVLDLQGTRSFGHTEQDDPSITQPSRYNSTLNMLSMAEIYRARLGLKNDKSVLESRFPLQHQIDVDTHADQAAALDSSAAAIPEATLRRVARSLTSIPEWFHAHAAVKEMTADWTRQAHSEVGVDWTLAENLALGTLLNADIPVRLTGMDAKRGTFHHRYACWYDQETGAEYRPLDQLSDSGRAKFDIHNSPLSELACLGFEYGYSLDFDGLVIWEAQYGDFVNNAQALLDQIITTAEEKWGYRSRLCIALPHGYEGYGPEHSSAFVARFLSLAANQNIRIEMPSTSAQWFHMLRRQALDPQRKPLITFIPKEKLRTCRESHAFLPEFSGTSAQDVLYTPARATARRLIACAGKIYFDLLAAINAGDIEDVAIVRLERLYPFPHEALQALSIAGIHDFCWLQEEAKNHGAWHFVRDELEAWTHLRWRYAGRPASASCADCDYEGIARAQALLVQTALRPDSCNAPATELTQQAPDRIAAPLRKTSEA